MKTVMFFILTIPLIFGVSVQAAQSGSSIALDQFAVKVNTSKNLKELVKKSFPKRKAIQEHLLSYFKNPTRALPKAIYEDETLFLKEGMQKLSLRYMNLVGEELTFLLNGRTLKIQRTDSIVQIVSKVTVKIKDEKQSSVMQLIVPSSYAMVAGGAESVAGFIMIPIIAITLAVDEMQSYCSTAAIEFQKLLHRAKMNLAKINSCSDGKSEATYISSDGKRSTVKFDVDSFYQFTETIEEKGKPSVTIQYGRREQLTKESGEVFNIAVDGKSIEESSKEYRSLKERFQKFKELNYELAGTWDRGSLGYDCVNGNCRKTMNELIPAAQSRMQKLRESSPNKTQSATEE